MKKKLIEKLKEANNIIDVAQNLGLKINNNRIPCFHPENHNNNDEHFSIYLNPKTNTYRCMVCSDVSGDIISFIRIIKGFKFVEALEYLANRAGLDINGNSIPSYHKLPTKKSTLEFTPIIDFKKHINIYQQFLRSCITLPEEATDWLTKRGISIKTIDLMKIKYAKEPSQILNSLKSQFSTDRLIESGLLNKHGNLFCNNHPLIWVYSNDGLPCYFQGRTLDKNIKPKEMNISAPIPAPYNIDVLMKKPKTIIICEGVTDCLTLIEHNYSAIGVIGVNGFKKEWFPYFKNIKVKVAFDADLAGQQRSYELVQKFHQLEMSAEKVYLPIENDVNRFFQILSQFSN
ncbi:MAG: hypothetical protein DRP35_04800 [Candidatus Zixiibacteriota bacterium]|nr:MAG: hypothetical protein DRP35_04800 [candidate division Zixibacteria bacterium]